MASGKFVALFVCEKTVTSKGLWDRFGKPMDFAPTNKCIFRHFLGVAYLLLNSFYLKEYFL